MYLENKKESNEENIEENNKGKCAEDRFVKNSVDYCSCEHSSSNFIG